MKPEQVRSDISDAELERRWAAVRAAMLAVGLDALVMQNSNDWLGGYVKWFTDIPAANGYPRTVVFYLDAPMTVIEMGAFHSARDLGGLDPIHRGVGHLVHTPSFLSIGYTNHYDPDLLVTELRRTGVRRIGLLAPGALPHALVAALQLQDQLELTDGTEVVDPIKAVKSPEEISLIRKVAAIQDQVFAEVCNFVRPGVCDIDIANYAQALAHRLGSDQGIFLGTSAPLGRSSRFAGRHLQGRTLRDGEHFSLLIEVNGPGGMYLEIARTIVLGTASDALLSGFEHVRQAQQHTLQLIRPGAAPAGIADAHDRWMHARGLAPETRLYAHGQGTDMVERPLIRRDETMPLAVGMCLAVHPGYDDGEVFAAICDNYMVEDQGPGACLHRTAKQVFEIKGRVGASRPAATKNEEIKQ